MRHLVLHLGRHNQVVSRKNLKLFSVLIILLFVGVDCDVGIVLIRLVVVIIKVNPGGLVSFWPEVFRESSLDCILVLVSRLVIVNLHFRVVLLVFGLVCFCAVLGRLSFLEVFLGVVELELGKLCYPLKLGLV
ncbi:hypothetical protein HG530_004772 [Fusarium avenaceum]|nr:hypothetical protein HG530_004772 [Fusarium avenaceum]